MKKLDRENRGLLIILIVFWVTGYSLWKYRELITPLSYKIHPVPLTTYMSPTYVFGEIIMPFIVGILCFCTLLFLYACMFYALSLAMIKTRSYITRNVFIKKHILKIENVLILCLTVIFEHLTKDSLLYALYDEFGLVNQYGEIVRGEIILLIFYLIFSYYFIRFLYYFILLGIDLKREHFLNEKNNKQL